MTPTDRILDECCAIFKCSPQDLLARIEATQAGIAKATERLRRYKIGDYKVKTSATGFTYIDFED